MSNPVRGNAGPITRTRWFARRFVAEARRDVTVALERDSAARSRLEVGLLHPGVHALWAHRVSHALWSNRAPLAARAVSQTARLLTGIEIHPAATVRSGVFIDRGAGVVIRGTGLGPAERHPTIGSNVTIGPGAKVLGHIDVGSWSRIGANAVLTRSVGRGTVIVGDPVAWGVR